MRPLSETTVLVTGATDGLGKALATELAAGGATVLVHGRDDGRGEQNLAEIRERTGSDRLHWYNAEFASLQQVRELGTRVEEDGEQLDVLVNNAGIGTNLPAARSGSRARTATSVENRNGRFPRDGRPLDHAPDRGP